MAAGTLTLFYHPKSPLSRAVLVFLKLSSIPHRVATVNYLKGEQHSPEFLRINPAAQIPAIDDSGFHLSECQAILTYLHSTRNCADHWYPSDLRKRAKVDQFLHWYHINFQFGIGFYRKFYVDPMSAVEVSKGRPKEQENTLLKSLSRIEFEAGKQGFVAGSELSLADLAPHAYYNQLKAIRFDFSEFPKVREWGERLNSIPEVKEVTQAMLDTLVRPRG